MPTYRNIYATHPLLRKGGAHIQSKTGQRSRDHLDLLDEAADYLEIYFQQQSDSDALVGETEEEPMAPLSFCGLLKFTSSCLVISAWVVTF